MSAESDLFDALKDDASVAALIGTRIYPDARPMQDPLPAVLYTRDDTEIVASISGPILYERATFGLACFADSRASAEQLADAVRTALVTAKLDVLDRSTDYDPDSDTHVVIMEARHTA